MPMELLNGMTGKGKIMRGKNKIHLNQNTMQEALQCWVNQQFSYSKKLKVTNVSQEDKSGLNFMVTIEAQKHDNHLD